MFVIVHCGKEIEHNAAFDKVLFPIRSPSPSPSEGSPTRLLSHARPCLSTGWALNRRFDLTFGTAAVLAQGGGGYTRGNMFHSGLALLPSSAASWRADFLRWAFRGPA